MRRWVAPAAGSVRITGGAADANGACGDGVEVSIRKGAQVLWQRTIENGDATGFSYDLTASVAAGDQVNFAVNKRGENGCDSTNFDPTITYAGGVSAPARVNWLVSDQLGTPRMVVDETGSLSGVKRHDYLPFGEGLPVNVGGRTPQRGYGLDNVRQKFTGYERDDESGLDFAQARYYSNAQGRFTSVDPLLASGRPGVPQSWNRYTYALNNPLLFTDPSGLIWGRNDNSQVKWFADEEAMKKAGFNAFTPKNWEYEAADGRWVKLNPNGPGSSPPSDTWTIHDAFKNPYYVKGWDYATNPVALRPCTEPILARGAIETDYGASFALTGVAQGVFGVARAAAGRTISSAFATESGGAVFSTGGKAAADAASEFARATGGKTVNMTLGGTVIEKSLEFTPLPMRQRISEPIWNAASGVFARRASGPVNVFRGESVRDGATWLRNEVPNLLRNPNVQTGTVHKVP